MHRGEVLVVRGREVASLLDAEQATGARGFIRCTLAGILEGAAPACTAGDRPVVFSPFGLGILDLAVGKLVLDLALARGEGTVIDSFLPD
jgi:ornithine cyclodeaminase/alanine dehydrogenase-like protein (mu-crystallin family)